MAKHTIKGIGIGDSCAYGRAYCYAQVSPVIQRVVVQDVASELGRFEAAIQHVRDDLNSAAGAMKKTDEHSAEIFSAQQEFLDDPEYYGNIVEKIKQESINAECAVDSICAQLEEEFTQLEDEYFRARASDVRDISMRLIAHLSGTPLRTLADIDRPVIIVAEDLLPSDTVQLNPEYILAFCTQKGSATSHTALLAGSLGIPAIVGVGEAHIQNDQMLIVDSKKGVVYVDPSEEEIAIANERIKRDNIQKKQRIIAAQKRAVTQDGTEIAVHANIASAADVKPARDSGAEGSGLLRTELFFYQEDSLPSEERQVEMYSAVARAFDTCPVTVRTLDIGGDKPLKALQGQYVNDTNPFLGVRGIRLTDQYPDVLTAQLRALMRAYAECEAEVKIMFPFVSIPDEVRRLRELFDVTFQQLAGEYSAVKTKPQMGVMIEIPSAALMIDHIMQYVEFVSIGTNDLAQYTCAVDRTNEQVSGLADYYNPAILKLIDMVLISGRTHAKPVSVCGEMAGDTTIIPLLYGMGLLNYSMSAANIPKAKEVIGTLNRQQCEELRAICLSLESAEKVREQLNAFASAHS